jgi:hypothetical protein
MNRPTFPGAFGLLRSIQTSRTTQLAAPLGRRSIRVNLNWGHAEVVVFRTVSTEILTSPEFPVFELV